MGETRRKRSVREAKKPRTWQGREIHPEWGDRIRLRIVAGRADLLPSEGEDVEFLVGEAEWDTYSEAARTMGVGEIAEFEGPEEPFAAELLEWREVGLPPGAAEVVRFDDIWKVVWRASDAPWHTPTSDSDVAYRASTQRIVERPERPPEFDDDYVDAFPEADEIFLEPDEWPSETTVSPPSGEGTLRFGLERMAKNERATFYMPKSNPFRLEALDAHVIDWTRREAAGTGYKRTLLAPPNVSWKTPEPLDTVVARVSTPTLLKLEFPVIGAVESDSDEIAATWCVDRSSSEFEPLEAVVATMRCGEIAEVLDGDSRRVAVVELIGLEPATPSVSDLKDAGNAAFDRGEVPRALRRYDEAVAAALVDGGDRAALHANRAACFLRLEKHRDALGAADVALSINPDHVQALRRKAKAHVALGELAEAVVPLKRCLHLDPTNALAKREASHLRTKLAARKQKARDVFGSVFNKPSSSSSSSSSSSVQPPVVDAREDNDDAAARFGFALRARRAGRVASLPEVDPTTYEDFETYW